MIRRAATAREALPDHSFACEHCGKPVGLPRGLGAIRLPCTVYVRRDNALVTECACCRRETTLPYRRAS